MCKLKFISCTWELIYINIKKENKSKNIRIQIINRLRNYLVSKIKRK